jgi:ABC-2 type transport system permease protein
MRRFVYVARAVAWRSIHNTVVSPAILLPSIIFPLFFLVAFAGGLSRIADVPNFHYAPGYTAFQFVFVFLQSAAFGGVFTGFAVARDFDSGFARRLLLSAPRRSGIIAGYATGALLRWGITGTVVTLAGLIAGMNVDGTGTNLIGLLGLGIIFNFVAALWGCGVAMFLRTEQAGALIQMPVFVLLFLAPVYVPLPLLTGWIHDVARLNPATVVLEAGRGLLAGSPVKVGLAFALLAGSAAVLAVFARRGLASAERAGSLVATTGRPALGWRSATVGRS